MKNEPITVAQTRGPSIKGYGHKLWTESRELHSGTLTATLWETEAGNWIMATRKTTDGYDRDLVAGTVIEKGDEFEMRCAALEALEWGILADRLKQALKWRMIIRVA